MRSEFISCLFDWAKQTKNDFCINFDDRKSNCILSLFIKEKTVEYTLTLEKVEIKKGIAYNLDDLIEVFETFVNIKQ